MSRLVEHDATGPVRLDESDIDDEKGDIAICRCGLTEDPPFCDASHEAARDEEAGERYWYEDGERYPVDLVRRSE
ncbi:CDGSH iron-sulfur domain-containing protein [Halomarina salina]|uniref:CDGSH iron-sulfur domain-containing protein n=1 Tax=Halomarina salina TaxID=1872699 RepID=A0ABD5RGN7_9EURY|nr:CDGSH iron-sulfur domain-containing protein [Halomarina salina]